MSGWVPSFLLKRRREHIRTWMTHGTECMVCWDEIDRPADGSLPEMVALHLDAKAVSILLDICIPCAKRLSAQVDARIEDRRATRNRGS